MAWVAHSNSISYASHLDYISHLYAFVAVDEFNHPVGFLYAKPFHHDVYIMEVDVDQQRQKQGIGRALIHHLFNQAAKDGMQCITLTTFRHVVWNQLFYEKLGFQVSMHNLPT